MVRGKFITLEGGEGAGKSTQIAYLATYLRSRGLEVIETREVGGSPAAEEIRKLWLTKADGVWDPITEILLIAAARRDHLIKKIWPALDRGQWVISDRFIDSTRAYQGIALNLGVDKVNRLYEFMAGDFQPDITFLLDLPVYIGMSRVGKRGGEDDRFQQKDVLFHQTLRNAYLSLAAIYPERIKIIDAQVAVESVTQQIQHDINQYILS